ncbi:inositol monophosphatase family protein, partial [Vibrio parahaemolyticus]
ARFDAADLRIDTKPDRTHVTEADLATERAIREILDAERPDDAILGEEYGTTGDTARRWVIDPIDGTHNYMRGIPVWATLIALTPAGEVAAHGVYALGDRMIAEVLDGWSAEDVHAYTALTSRFVKDAIASSERMRERGLRPLDS